MFSIRAATSSDVLPIVDIYNHSVRESTATYQIEPDREEDRQSWLAQHRPETHPVFVATSSSGEVVAWGSLSRFHPRAAFAHTVENSIYVHPAFLRQGLGRKMLDRLIRAGTEIGHRCIIAAIDSEQVGSLALHHSMGFKEVGRLPDVGFKFDRWLTLVTLQLQLPK